jgi:nitrate/nitrite-specific signal transduction histidine kinase
VGLKIMRERAQQIGAKVTVDSAIGQGTVVTLQVPTLQPSPSKTKPTEILSSLG